QAMMTVIPPLFDERAPYNEINGLALYDFENPGSVTNMKTLVAYFDTEEGAFVDESDVRSLQTHLTAVSQYEEKGLGEKVIKHVEGFKQLLHNQKENRSISENAYTDLQTYTDYIIEKWEHDEIDVKISFEMQNMHE